MAATESTALYRVIGDADLLLYIGVSKHFGIRWQRHAREKPWWDERRRMIIDWYDTRDEALDAEALAIYTEQPKYNVLHRKQAQRLISAGHARNRPGGPARQRTVWPQEFTKSERAAAARITRLRLQDSITAKAIEHDKCWSCHAAHGELCHTASGKITYYHTERVRRSRFYRGPIHEVAIDSPEYWAMANGTSVLAGGD